MMPQDTRDDHKDETEKLRAEAAEMLERARNQLADIQRALSSLGGDRAAHGRLSAEADRLSAIVTQLTQAVNASSRCGGPISSPSAPQCSWAKPMRP